MLANPITWFPLDEPEALGALGIASGGWGWNIFLPPGLPTALPPTDETLEPDCWFDFFYQREAEEPDQIALHIYQRGNDEALAHVRWFPDGRVVIEDDAGRILQECLPCPPKSGS